MLKHSETCISSLPHCKITWGVWRHSTVGWFLLRSDCSTALILVGSQFFSSCRAFPSSLLPACLQYFPCKDLSVPTSIPTLGSHVYLCYNILCMLSLGLSFTTRASISGEFSSARTVAESMSFQYKYFLPALQAITSKTSI